MPSKVFQARDYKYQLITFEVPGLTLATCEGVTLMQSDDGLFSVVYGLDVKSQLDHDRAARAFGHAVFHALACNGAIEPCAD